LLDSFSRTQLTRITRKEAKAKGGPEKSGPQRWMARTGKLRKKGQGCGDADPVKRKNTDKMSGSHQGATPGSRKVTTLRTMRVR